MMRVVRRAWVMAAVLVPAVTPAHGQQAGGPAAAEATASERFDAARLAQGTFRYRVMVQGSPFGTATTVMSQDGEVWSGTSTVVAGPLTQVSELRFREDLTPISVTSSMVQGEMRLSSTLRYENGRMVGRIEMPEVMGGTREIDVAAPAGTLFNGMDVVALATTELAPGKTLDLAIFSEQTGTVVQTASRVVAVESVTVPAGTFDAFRVEMTAGPQGGTLWVRREAPHVLLKQEVTGQPVVIELEAM